MANSTGHGETMWKRMEMGGQNYRETERRRSNLLRTLPQVSERERRYRAGVVQTGTTGEGGAFSNSAEQFGEKSQFNKEKWLPLARDIPVPISHYCCRVMKKAPLKAYQKKTGLHPILATMAEESRMRTQAWLRTGCNAFDAKEPKSQPMSFWTEQDVLQYIVENGIEIASVYGDIVSDDMDGIAYQASGLLIPGGKLRCTGCSRTGQMNAAR